MENIKAYGSYSSLVFKCRSTVAKKINRGSNQSKIIEN